MDTVKETKANAPICQNEAEQRQPNLYDHLVLERRGQRFPVLFHCSLLLYQKQTACAQEAKECSNQSIPRRRILHLTLQNAFLNRSG